MILALEAAVIEVSDPDKKPDNKTKNIRESNSNIVRIDII